MSDFDTLMINYNALILERNDLAEFSDVAEEKIEYFRNFTNKLWNISRFILLGGILEGKPKRPEAKTLADQWILARFDEVIRSVTDDLEGMNCSRPGETLRDFTWGELADWYLEIAKIEGDKQEILAYLLAETLKLWHPFMPFVTEEIWKRTFAEGDKDMIMVADWPEPSGEAADPQIMKGFRCLQEIVVAVRNTRSQNKVPNSQFVDELIGQKVDGADKILLEENIGWVKGLSKVKEVKFIGKFEIPDGDTVPIPPVFGMTWYVRLGRTVDATAEKMRLEKELDDKNRYKIALESKLSNKEFCSRAPKEVVKVEEVKLLEVKDDIVKLREQIDALG